jgi:hypothetical protein
VHLYVGSRGMDVLGLIYYLGSCLTICSASILFLISSLLLRA